MLVQSSFLQTDSTIWVIIGSILIFIAMPSPLTMFAKKSRKSPVLPLSNQDSEVLGPAQIVHWARALVIISLHMYLEAEKSNPQRQNEKRIHQILRKKQG